MALVVGVKEGGAAVKDANDVKVYIHEE